MRAVLDELVVVVGRYVFLVAPVVSSLTCSPFFSWALSGGSGNGSAGAEISAERAGAAAEECGGNAARMGMLTKEANKGLYLCSLTSPPPPVSFLSYPIVFRGFYFFLHTVAKGLLFRWQIYTGIRRNEERDLVITVSVKRTTRRVPFLFRLLRQCVRTH